MPTAPTRLYLHIGTHKTGTTSLQAFLLDHKAELSAQQVHVCTERHRTFGKRANCFGFAHAILRPSLMTVARMTGNVSPGNRPAYCYHRLRLRRQFSRLPRGVTSILSAEALCFARTQPERQRLRRIFKGLKLEVVPVVCIRNEEDWRESWSTELQNWSDRMAHEFGDGRDDVRGDWYFDQEDILRFWESIGPVRQVDYDDAVRENGNVLPALLDALDVPAIGNTDDYFLRQRQG